MGRRRAPGPLPPPPAGGEAADHARSVGLRYVALNPPAPGIRRLRRGASFRYVTPEGRALRDRNEIARIRKLAIPPAWSDVWICPWPLGHVQAFGRDARGRRQYRYHARWREVRDETKYGQLVAFGRGLPAIRRRVRSDLARPGMPREKLLATVVELLDRTMMRVGNEEYAKANRSFGLTTLRDRHAKVKGAALELSFRGKSGKAHTVRVDDRRLARIVKACQDLPGNELFQYVDEAGAPQSVDSADVNAYLREIAASADVSAKVFRTWAGTVRALAALRALAPAVDEAAGTKASLVGVVKEVAGRLGNTPAVCRKCYIHPAVLEGFEQGTLHASLERLGRRGARTRGLDADERLTLAFLADAARHAGRAPSLAASLRRSVERAARIRTKAKAKVTPAGAANSATRARARKPARAISA